MENYISMNGQKISLNEEQIKIIANIIGLSNNPFNRCTENEIYYYCIGVHIKLMQFVWQPESFRR